MRPSFGLWLLLLPTVAGGPALVHAQACAADGCGEATFEIRWVSTPPPPPSDSMPSVDVAARFLAFQRDFERDFGARPRGGGGDRAAELGEKVAKRLTDRFEGGRIYGWYVGGRRLYDRAEGLYERIETSTRWTTRGVSVDADVESAVYGDGRLHVEKRVKGFRLGLDVNDAAEGRFGVRLAGVVRGYHLNMGVGDFAHGQLRVGVKKRLE